MVTLSDFSGLIRATTRGKNGRTTVLQTFAKTEVAMAAASVVWWSCLPKIYHGGPRFLHIGCTSRKIQHSSKWISFSGMLKFSLYPKEICQWVKDKSGLLNSNSPQVIQQSFVSGNWCKILKSGLILVVYGWTNIVMSNFLQKSPKVVEIKNIL